MIITNHKLNLLTATLILNALMLPQASATPDCAQLDNTTWTDKSDSLFNTISINMNFYDSSDGECSYTITYYNGAAKYYGDSQCCYVDKDGTANITLSAFDGDQPIIFMRSWDMKTLNVDFLSQLETNDHQFINIHGPFVPA